MLNQSSAKYTSLPIFNLFKFDQRQSILSNDGAIQAYQKLEVYPLINIVGLNIDFTVLFVFLYRSVARCKGAVRQAYRSCHWKAKVGNPSKLTGRPGK